MTYDEYIARVKAIFHDSPNMQQICIINWKSAECGMSYGHYTVAPQEMRDRAKAERGGKDLPTCEHIKITRRRRPLVRNGRA